MAWRLGEQQIDVEVGQRIYEDVGSVRTQLRGGHGSARNGDGTNAIGFGSFDVVAMIADETDAAIGRGV
jgi:hypothetical protein